MNKKFAVLKVSVMMVAAGALTIVPKSVAAQINISVRELAPVEATSVDHFGIVLSVRPLKNGGILVNDAGRRQLIILDAALSNWRVLLDSTSVRGMSYGPLGSPVIPYVADSSLFVDGQSLALIKISPQGELLAVVSAPDSLPVVRANFDTRSIDTLARVRAPYTQRVTSAAEPGRTVITVTINPLTELDEWAVLSDGTIAIVRGHDYHVDVLQAGKAWTSGPKLPFARKRLSDTDKQALLDSSRSERDHKEAMQKLNTSGSALTAANSNGEVTRVRIRGSDESSAPLATPTVLKTEFVAASQLVDYWPVLRSGTALR